MKQTPNRLADSNPGSFLLFTIVAMIGSSAVAQNLVPNGGFEEGITCPSFVGNVAEECAFWYGSLIGEEEIDPTPDWFHTCSLSDDLSPPDLAFGFQIPAEGNGYAGIVTYGTNDTAYRETIAVQLLEELIIGQTYLVEFKVSSLPNEDIGIETNNIGFNFSTHPTYSVLSFPINSSHFNIDTIIPLSDSWTSVSEIFTADSAYSYFHIGNFFYSSLISAELAGPNSFMGYYVIDDVRITSVLSNYSENAQSFGLYPNPTNNTLKIESNGSFEASFIYAISMSGQSITMPFSRNANSIEVNVCNLPSGMYILIIETPKTTYYEKFIKA